MSGGHSTDLIIGFGRKKSKGDVKGVGKWEEERCNFDAKMQNMTGFVVEEVGMKIMDGMLCKHTDYSMLFANRLLTKRIMF